MVAVEDCETAICQTLYYNTRRRGKSGSEGRLRRTVIKGNLEQPNLNRAPDAERRLQRAIFSEKEDANVPDEDKGDEGIVEALVVHVWDDITPTLALVERAILCHEPMRSCNSGEGKGDEAKLVTEVLKHEC